MERLTRLVLNDIRDNYNNDLDDDNINAVDQFMREIKWKLYDKKGRKKAVSMPVIIKYLPKQDCDYYYYVFEAIIFEYHNMLFYEIGVRYYRGKDERLAQTLYNAIVE